ncbi:MAG: GNAT family N-acetyltransferase [Desulfobacterales bacterium]|nr:GNAT family N-acetyltransferase [Desulfobacterales bacterium]
MEILAANLKDSKKIFSIIERCKEKLVSQGIYQWDDEYPNLINIQEDINTGALYEGVLESQIASIISFNENQEKEYLTVNWRYTNGIILVIHRLAVDPDFQGLGLSSILMKYVENYAIENSYSAIRLDAYTGNEMILDFYRRKGYQEAGEFYFPSRSLPFKCFEKSVPEFNKSNSSDAKKMRG